MCDHEWHIVPESDLGGDRDEVRCNKCGVGGELDHRTHEVYWPVS